MFIGQTAVTMYEIKCKNVFGRIDEVRGKCYYHYEIPSKTVGIEKLGIKTVGIDIIH